MRLVPSSSLNSNQISDGFLLVTWEGEKNSE
jgi:hypothetical protein